MATTRFYIVLKPEKASSLHSEKRSIEGLIDVGVPSSYNLNKDYCMSVPSLETRFIFNLKNSAPQSVFH